MRYRFGSNLWQDRVSMTLICLTGIGLWSVLSADAVDQIESEDHADRALSGIRLIWAWSVQPERNVEKAVAQAQELGFNAVGWNNQEVVPACKRRGMMAFALISPLNLQRGGAHPQILAEGEAELPGFDRRSDDSQHPFQYGGEPVAGNNEILHMNLSCPRGAGVIEYAVAEAGRYQRLGYHGICWDFIGFRNYRSCECDRCLKALADRQAEENISRESFYLATITDLYSELYRRVKELAPELLIATHIYPVYLPNILYGSKVKVDYCGETVAWFFQPHWSFEKIRTYARKTLNAPYEHESTEAMPMIGFYGDREFSRDEKSPERLKLELEILKQEGARHFMMCELGHVLRNSAAMRAIKEAL